MWEKCRDVCSGEDAMHEAGDKYLPRLKDQDAASYLRYVKRTPFYNASWRTIAGLTGMIFRKPPKVEAPEEFVGKPSDKDTGTAAVPGKFDDVDGLGLPLQLFMQKVTEETLKQNRVGVLVDYPPAPDGITEADAQRLNLKPTMQIYDTFSIINWKTARINNETVLVLVVLKETEWVVKDEYEFTQEDRWRVLDLVNLPATVGDNTPATPVYRQRLFRLDVVTKAGGGKKGISTSTFTQIGADIIPKMNGKPMAYIPFKIIQTDDSSFEVDEPPLIDLINMNVSHYQTSASLEHGCHFTALPTLVLTGWKKENPNDKVYLGSEAALVTSNPEAKATFCEFSGQGLGALEKNLDRKEKQMAVLGARMLEPQIRGVESAEVASIHRVGEQSMLSSVSMAISLNMTKVVKWFVEWGGGDPLQVKIQMNKDFYPVPMTPQMLLALISGWQQGVPGLSDQGLFEQLKAGEIVAEDVDLEDEQERIANRQLQQAQENMDLNKKLGLNPDGTPIDGGETATPGATAGPPTGDTGQAIHIHLPKGGTKKITKTGNGQYTVEDQ